MYRRTSDPTAPVATKRSLVAVSRVLEDIVAVESARIGHQVATIACFQHVGYFEQELARYSQLASLGPVVVAYTGQASVVPPGVHAVTMDDVEPLSDEWAVIVLSAGGHGALMSHDLSTAVEAGSIEQGRLFSYEVTTEPFRVVEHASRILDELGERVPAAVRASVEQELANVSAHDDGSFGTVLGRAAEAAMDGMLRVSALLQDAERKANTDPLTGVANRRVMERFLARVGARAPSVAVLAFDLDDFEVLNDTYGHAAGDVVLRGFADVLRQHSRTTDLAVRTGGDEFVLLLPGMPDELARTRAHSIIETFSALRFAAPADQARPGCSAGVGVFAPTEIDLAAVDRALDEARRSEACSVVVVTAAADAV